MDSASDNYKMTVGGYSGTAGDSMVGGHSHNDMQLGLLDQRQQLCDIFG